MNERVELQKELNRFRNILSIPSAYFTLNQCGEDIYHLVPHQVGSAKKMGFMALVHGNEYLGLPILNQLFEDLLSGKTKADCEIYFGLGNVPASFSGTRFVEEDLNRAFGLEALHNRESLRARELEQKMLNHCDYLIDLHQTVGPSRQPFFIFQYASHQCLHNIHLLNPGIPTILQFEQIGTDTGLSSDEYMRKIGKFGVALELGQKGTNHYFDLGLSICRKALELVSYRPQRSVSELQFSFPLLQMNGRYHVEDDSSQLNPGWENFSEILQGEKMGRNGSGDIHAPASGFMLFPRYRPVSAGQELYYFCTPLALDAPEIVFHATAAEPQINIC